MRTIALLLDPALERRVEALQLAALLADHIVARGDRLVLFSDPLGALLVGCALIGSSPYREAERSEPEPTHIILVPVITSEDPFATAARDGAAFEGEPDEEEVEGRFGGLADLHATAALEIIRSEDSTEQVMRRVLDQTRPAVGIILAARPDTAQLRAMREYDWPRQALVASAEFVESRPERAMVIEDDNEPDEDLLRTILRDLAGDEEASRRETTPHREEVIAAAREAMTAEAWLSFLDEGFKAR